MNTFGIVPASPLPQQQQQPAQQPLFGLIVPGCAVRTDFVPIDPNGLKFALRLSCPGDIPTPLTSILDIVFFLTTPIVQQQQAEELGVVVYWQISSAINPTTASTGYELLGHVSNNTPSAVFRTGWSEHEQTVELGTMNPPIPVIVTIGLSIEPLSQIQNYSPSSVPSSPNNNFNTMTTTTPATTGGAPTEQRLFVAQKIASDLYTFMQSFDTGAGIGQQTMVVPTNIFERWYKRFEARFRRDPNFFLKSSTD